MSLLSGRAFEQRDLKTIESAYFSALKRTNSHGYAWKASGALYEKKEMEKYIKCHDTDVSSYST